MRVSKVLTFRCPSKERCVLGHLIELVTLEGRCSRMRALRTREQTCSNDDWYGDHCYPQLCCCGKSEHKDVPISQRSNTPYVPHTTLWLPSSKCVVPHMNAGIHVSDFNFLAVIKNNAPLYSHQVIYTIVFPHLDYSHTSYSEELPQV